MTYPTIERDLGFVKGAKFYRDAEGDKFVFGIDPNNVIGPRIARDADKRDFPGEWKAYQAGRPQLDHDGDGKPGGVAPPVDTPKGPAGLTKPEIIADLEDMGIEFDPRAHRATLLGQRNAARKARDAPP